MKVRTWMAIAMSLVIAAAACGTAGDGSSEAESSTTSVELPTTTESPSTTTSTSATTTSLPVTGVDEDVVYHEDSAGRWMADVFYPIGDGPWPLVVVIPPGMEVGYVGPELAERGVVAVVAQSWTTEGWVDPAVHLNGEMNRAACVVGWAQEFADDYNADPARTTVDGYSGGAMAATWVGLGLADDSVCQHPISVQPVGLVAGESQFIYQHARWDATFATGAEQPFATIDGLLNPERWVVPADLQVALWSAAVPIGETRDVEDPLSGDSWIWLREAGTPIVDDLAELGAFDDGMVDWADNADLIELRMQAAGVSVRNETFNIGHRYTDEVFDLIVSVQS